MADSLTVGILRVLLTANTAEFEQKLKESSKTAKEWSKDIGSMGRTATAAGQTLTAALTLPIAGIGVAATKMATDLNKSLANVSALLTKETGPALEATVAKMRGEVQSLAVSLGKSTEDISGGLYEVISSLGLTGDTFKQLEISAKAGAAGLATTKEAFSFLSAVTKTYGDTSQEAFKKVADLGFQAVNIGQTTFPELAASIGGVAPLAKVAGVRMEEMFAVIATATGVTGNTSEVVTQMASAINALLNPSSQAKEAFKQLGVASGEALIQERGFVGALQALAEHARATGTPMLDLLGRKEAFILTASLAGEQAQRFAGNLGEMTTAAAASGGVVEAAFEKQTQGVNKAGFAWEQLKAKFEVAGQRLGEALIPHLLKAGDALKPLVDGLIGAVGAFGQLPAPVQAVGVGLGLMAAAAGPVLLVFGQMALGVKALIDLLTYKGLAAKGLATTFGTLTKVAGGLAAALGGAIGVGLTAVLVGVGVALDKVEQWTRGSLQAMRDGTATIGDFAAALVNATIRAAVPFGAAWRDISEAFKRLPGEIVVFKDAVVRTAQQLYEGVKTWLVDRFNGIVTSLTGKIDTVKNAFKDLYDKVVGNSYVPDLISGIAGEFGKLTPVMVEPTRAATRETARLFSDLSRSIGDAFGRAFSDLLDTTTSFKDDLLNLWGSIKQGLSDIVDSIINDVFNRLAQGLRNVLTGQGGFGQAFSGFMPGLFGGGGGLTNSAGVGSATWNAAAGMPGGAAGATPWWSTAMGGGAIGGAAGAVVGGVIGVETGNRAGAAGAGAGTGATVGAILGGPIGAGIGAIIGAGVGYYAAMRENVKTNDLRDQFISQFGPQGTGEGSGFHSLAAKLTEATGEAGGGRLFQDLIKQNDRDGLRKAIEAVNVALAEYAKRTGDATAAEQAHSAAIEQVRAEHQARIDDLKAQSAEVNKQIADWDAREAPEEVMGAVEAAARAELAQQQQAIQTAIQENQAAMEAALAAATTAATETGGEIGTALDGGFQIGKAAATTFADWLRDQGRLGRFDAVGTIRLTPEVYALGSIPNIPPVPDVYAAEGFHGMVHRPTLIMAGEAGPERVDITPKGQMRGGSTGAAAPTHVTFHINALDARSFEDLVRNPQRAKAITSAMLESLTTGGDNLGRFNEAIRHTMNVVRDPFIRRR